jgi:uncharacterized protein (TIGR00252 family)
MLTSRRERPAPDALPPGRPLKDRVGQAGESAALAWVRDQGWTVLARDWRARTGQIDIVAEDGETLVLVEVKARRGTGFGLPEEAVDARKQQRLRTLMETYRLATKRSGSSWTTGSRSPGASTSPTPWGTADGYPMVNGAEVETG